MRVCSSPSRRLPFCDFALMCSTASSFPCQGSVLDRHRAAQWLRVNWSMTPAYGIGLSRRFQNDVGLTGCCVSRTSRGDTAQCARRVSSRCRVNASCGGSKARNAISPIMVELAAPSRGVRRADTYSVERARETPPPPAGRCCHGNLITTRGCGHCPSNTTLGLPLRTKLAASGINGRALAVFLYFSVGRSHLTEARRRSGFRAKLMFAQRR
jgi:hypothetical protein